jgi:hypothetical protein
MHGVIVATALAAAAPSAAPVLERSGLNGWGIGLELPMVGVMTGAAQKSRFGWGYTLGGALSWEVTPWVETRLYLSGGQTFGGSARVRYIDNVSTGARKAPAQPAEWVGAEIGVGGAYLFRDIERQWTPYIGVDLAATFAGYTFTLEDDLASLEGFDRGDAFERCTGEECAIETHDAIAADWLATLRGGVRLELADWLATQVELALSYTRNWNREISNTVGQLDVRTAREHILVIRSTFTVRLGL